MLSVIVEGGSATIQRFIEENLWDEARVLVGQTLFKEGLKAPALSFRPISQTDFYGDTIYRYKNLKK